MSWSFVQNLFTENLGMDFSGALFIIYMLLGIIWFAVDYKVGVTMLIVIGLGFFVWLYLIELSFAKFLVSIIIGIILLAFTLYSNAMSKYNSGIV